jgi:hypothetical protein
VRIISRSVYTCPAFFTIEKAYASAGTTKKTAYGGLLCCVCVLGGRKNAPGWEDPLLEY